MSLATTDTTMGRVKASTRVRRSEEDGKKKREKQNAYRSAEGTKRKRGNAAMSHRRLEGNDKNAREDAEQLYNLDGEKRTQETDADGHGRSISDKVEKLISGKNREKKGANSEQSDVAEDFEKFDEALGESFGFNAEHKSNTRRSRDGRIGSLKLMSKNGIEEISVRLSYKTVNELDNHVKAGRNYYPDGTTRTRETDAARHTRGKRKVPGDAERSYYPDGTERTRMSDAERHKEKPLRITGIGDAARTCYPDGTQRTMKTHNFIITMQNFNGTRKHDRESVKEEMVLQMKRHNIDMLCCQETSLPTTSDERWDSEEIMLGGGIEETRCVSKHSKAPNCFLLSKHMSTLFEKGGNTSSTVTSQRVDKGKNERAKPYTHSMKLPCKRSGTGTFL
jgi:hypothetical protein